MQTDRVLVSRVGYEKLQQKLSLLRHERDEKQIRLGEVARDDPDLPENISFKQLKVELQFDYPKRIRGVESMLARAVFIEEQPEYLELKEDTVWVGCQVTLLDLGSQENEVWQILGIGEADPDLGCMSYEAPFARALIGKTVNEEFDFNGRTLRVVIVEKVL